jgi:hypothetical protein
VIQETDANPAINSSVLSTALAYNGPLTWPGEGRACPVDA